MSHEGDRCLAGPEILAYLDGELAEGRRSEVTRHLDECRLCGAAVEGVAGLEWREGFLKSADALKARVRARTAVAVTASGAARRSAARFRPAPMYLTLAASLVLASAATVYLTRPGPGEALFQQYFEPYPSTQPGVRGAGSADVPTGALVRYEARDYSGALAALEAGLAREPNDAQLLFYAGLSRLALGNAREAERDLERVRELGDPELRGPAAWYLALADLRRHDLAAARSRLTRVAEEGGFYKDKAREVLAELDRLHPVR
jgi:tetratricopeptide (TPR) repeat protein